MANRAVDTRRFYFSIEAYGKIIDAYFDYEGKTLDWYVQNKRAVWMANFKLYTETESILARIEDPECDLFPLYRGLGEDDEDFIFASRDDAYQEYEDHINDSIADKLYNL